MKKQSPKLYRLLNYVRDDDKIKTAELKTRKMNKKNKQQNKARAFSLSFGEGWGGALILIIIFTISSCRKYPEGGSYFLSNMTKKIAGKYSFTNYYIDGVDSVNYYFNNDYVGYLEIVESKGYPDGIGFSYFFDNNSQNSNNFVNNGYWDWNNKKKTNFYISISDFYDFNANRDTIVNCGPFSSNTKSNWDIKKLKNNELIIETDYNNKHYRAELKK